MYGLGSLTLALALALALYISGLGISVQDAFAKKDLSFQNKFKV